ncbi:MAG: transposase, partial [Proteobacteria bacterium]|nr:transposase [Pseudomonadota bacterium]
RRTRSAARCAAQDPEQLLGAPSRGRKENRPEKPSKKRRKGHPGAARKLADSTLAAYSRDLKRRLDRLLARQPDTVAGRKLRNAMERARDKLFVFVPRRDVPATNNVSERLLRPSVIFRKVTGGFRSVWGAQVYADICSVIATGALNGLNALDAIRACLKGRSVIAVV